jgi:hypothetical protein
MITKTQASIQQNFLDPPPASAGRSSTQFVNLALIASELADIGVLLIDP